MLFRSQLMMRARDGSWHSHPAGVDAVVEQLLPWELRDFFVMDADEAADFVGGSENKVLSRQEVTAKTTYAVRALLGLEVFKQAEERVSGQSREFGREATRAAGDADLLRRQQELDELRKQEKELKGEVNERRQQERELAAKLADARDTLESLVGSIEAHEQLKHRLQDNRTRREDFSNRYEVAVERYAGELRAADLLGVLAERELAKVQGTLQPLYDSDKIPLKHLGFVRSLLRSGVCVCGQDLVEARALRRHVEEVLEQSSGQEERADHLAHVLEATDNLRVHRDEAEWESRCNDHAADLASIDDELGVIEDDRRDIEGKLTKVEDDQVQATHDKIHALETQRDRTLHDLSRSQQELEHMSTRITELDQKNTRQRKRKRAAQDQEACKDTADAIVEVLSRAYATIQNEQVRELAAVMDGLFSNMVANVADDDAQETHRKATLKMIAEVGLRSVEGSTDKFEVFALNHRARSMPPTEINGASRRTLALAFVLALCRVSNTRAPLVADSLLNFMSGVGRTNTLRVTATGSTQPILLLTGADLEAHAELEIIERFAGATYTLTGQWQHGTQPGDVANQSDLRRVALLCECAPRQYCHVCKRVGQANLAGRSRSQERNGATL